FPPSSRPGFCAIFAARVKVAYNPFSSQLNTTVAVVVRRSEALVAGRPASAEAPARARENSTYE
ncbi:MAG: hypothetical protein ABW250_18685, partial [Pyrinomonadaceae bacterium]